MKIRVATLNDIPVLLKFGAAFVQESPNYKNREFVSEEAQQHFESLIDGQGVIFVIEHHKEVIAGFAGSIGKDWFNNQKIAIDHVMYVLPEFRKTRAAYYLIQTFIGWAAGMGANRIQCGTTTDVESKGCTRLYEHFGFRQYGTVLDMEL